MCSQPARSKGEQAACVALLHHLSRRIFVKRGAALRRGKIGRREGHSTVRLGADHTRDSDEGGEAFFSPSNESGWGGGGGVL